MAVNRQAGWFVRAGSEDVGGGRVSPLSRRQLSSQIGSSFVLLVKAFVPFVRNLLFHTMSTKKRHEKHKEETARERRESLYRAS